jgi:hypothetical protein
MSKFFAALLLLWAVTCLAAGGKKSDGHGSGKKSGSGGKKRKKADGPLETGGVDDDDDGGNPPDTGGSAGSGTLAGHGYKGPHCATAGCMVGRLGSPPNMCEGVCCQLCAQTEGASHGPNCLSNWQWQVPVQLSGRNPRKILMEMVQTLRGFCDCVLPLLDAGGITNTSANSTTNGAIQSFIDAMPQAGFVAAGAGPPGLAVPCMDAVADIVEPPAPKKTKLEKLTLKAKAKAKCSPMPSGADDDAIEVLGGGTLARGSRDDHWASSGPEARRPVRHLGRTLCALLRYGGHRGKFPRKKDDRDPEGRDWATITSLAEELRLTEAEILEFIRLPENRRRYVEASEDGQVWIACYDAHAEQDEHVSRAPWTDLPRQPRGGGGGGAQHGAASQWQGAPAFQGSMQGQPNVAVPWMQPPPSAPPQQWMGANPFPPAPPEGMGSGAQYGGMWVSPQMQMGMQGGMQDVQVPGGGQWGMQMPTPVGGPPGVPAPQPLVPAAPAAQAVTAQVSTAAEVVPPPPHAPNGAPSVVPGDAAAAVALQQAATMQPTGGGVAGVVPTTTTGSPVPFREPGSSIPPYVASVSACSSSSSSSDEETEALDAVPVEVVGGSSGAAASEVLYYRRRQLVRTSTARPSVVLEVPTAPISSNEAMASTTAEGEVSEACVGVPNTGSASSASGPPERVVANLRRTTKSSAGSIKLV